MKTLPTLQQITTWVFTPCNEPRTPGGAIVWWEKRRLFYNVFVGSIGFCSLLVFVFFLWQVDLLQPGVDAGEPIVILLAPILVNICYTAGWIIELAALCTGIGRRHLRGPLLMRVGLVFSLFVVLLPSVAWGIFWASLLMSRH